METIQRGDQVYYRGEVWTVLSVAYNFKPATHAKLCKGHEEDNQEVVMARLIDLRRVEQVR